MKRHRFKVVEYASYYAIVDSKTGEERAMSDGVDALTTENGRSMRPGSEYFRATWERCVNESESETLEAYFPETYDDENREERLDIQDDDLRLDHIPDVSECRRLIREMKKDGYFPNVYHVNDHGNVDLLSIGYNGAKIVRSWV